MTTYSSRVAVMAETETQEELSVCPTFNCYSSDRLAEIAARVAGEFDLSNLSVKCEDNDDDGVGDDEFEFSLVRDGPEIFYDGQFGPIFPVFNRDVVDVGFGGDRLGTQFCDRAVVETQIGVPLKKLFIQEMEEEQGNPPSSSSSVADEMEGVPTGTYCVWIPKKVESSTTILGKKSNSAGSGSGANRWKFLNLLWRSNSEGKDTYVFLTPKHREVKSRKDQSHPSSEIVKADQKQNPRTATELPWNSPSHSPSPLRSPGHEALYLQNRAIKQGEKSKSFLPYKKDLVGFLANVNGLSRTLTPS